MSDYLTVKDGSGKVVYRPTVHYAYHPSDACIMSMHETAGRNYTNPERQRLIVDEIISGARLFVSRCVKVLICADQALTSSVCC